MLTQRTARDIIFKRSKNGALREGPKGRGNLENDTDKERETTVNSEMSFA